MTCSTMQTEHLKVRADDLDGVARDSAEELARLKKEKADVVQRWTEAVKAIAKRDQVGVVLNIIGYLLVSFRPLGYLRKR